LGSAEGIRKTMSTRAYGNAFGFGLLRGMLSPFRGISFVLAFLLFLPRAALRLVSGVIAPLFQNLSLRDMFVISVFLGAASLLSVKLDRLQLQIQSLDQKLILLGDEVVDLAEDVAVSQQHLQAALPKVRILAASVASTGGKDRDISARAPAAAAAAAAVRCTVQ